MGSLCASKPATTTSSSSQAYTPAGISQLNEIYGRVRDAASTPYTPYGGQMVSGLNPTQYGGIDKITGATDYLNTAGDYARSGASPIESGDIERYFNPFTQSVIGATQRNFAEGNAQQDERMKGNAIAQGAWGGDRAGVARAELMRQQKLAQDPVIAGLNSQGFNLALSAAQADRAAKAQGGYQFGALHNAALAGGQAQIGAGTVEQGNEQARLNAAYQQFMQQQAFPYQQAQFLASAGLPAVSAMGGTQTGQSQSQTKAAQPSWLQQGVGLGATALGMGGMNFMGGGGSTGPTYGVPFGQSGMASFGGVPYPVFARGGPVKGGGRRGFNHGGFIDTVHAIRQSLRRGGAVMDMGRDPNGIYMPRGYADGGDVPFADRFGAANDAISDGTFDPQGSNYYDPAASAPIASVPMPMARPQMANMSAPMALPPQIANPGGGDPIMMPSSAMGFAPQEPRAPMNTGPMPQSDGARPNNNLFGLSDDARLGLLSAGLGILASKNPNALGAIGEGGLAGVKTYTGAKQSRERNELSARKLIQDAEQFSRGIDVRERTLKETERAHKATEGLREEVLEQGNFQYLGPAEGGQGSVFLNKKTGNVEVRDTKVAPKKPDRLPTPIQKDLGEKGQSLATLTDLSGSFNDNYAGYKMDTVADITMEAARRGLGSEQTKNASEWWQNYDRYKAGVRHKLFGSALTAQEIAQWNKFDAKPSQSPDAVKRNIAEQDKIVRNALTRRAQSLVAQGYSKEAIEAETGLKLGDKSGAPAAEKPAAPIAPPPRPAAVPPGSQYSPSRKMWRDPSGALYSADGRPAQ